MNSTRIIKSAVLLVIGLIAVAFVNKNNTQNSDPLPCQPCQPPEAVQVNKASFAISHGHCTLPFSGVIEGMGVQYNAEQPQDLKIDFRVNTNSLRVVGGNEELSASVQSEKMFDGSGSNYITFQTNDVFVLGHNWFQLHGKMTIKGVEKVAQLRATPIREDGQIVKWIVEGTIDLDEFGIHRDADNESEYGHMMSVNLTAMNEGC